MNAGRNLISAFDPSSLADLGLPVTESNTTVPITIRARNFPVDMPMSGAYMGRKNITITGRSEMLNHASFYLE